MQYYAEKCKNKEIASGIWELYAWVETAKFEIERSNDLRIVLRVELSEQSEHWEQ